MTQDLPVVAGVEHRFVRAGDLRLHVAQAGSGAPVLLLHGWPQHWYCWRGVIPLLSGSFRLLCPDLRGFGWSDAPGGPYGPDPFAADAIALLDALEIERAWVIGHDWGGYAAFLLAARHPERVRAALVVNAPHPWVQVDPRAVDALWRAWYVAIAAAPVLGPLAVSRSRFVPTILRLDNVHPEGMPDEAVASFAGQFDEPARAHASAGLYRSYLRLFAQGVRGGTQEPRLSVPTRLLFGARDAFISKSLLTGWEPHADDMEVELVEDSGHFLPDEKPELVAERASSLFLGSGPDG